MSVKTIFNLEKKKVMKAFLLIFIHNLYTINRLKHKKRESEKKIIKKKDEK